MGIYSNKNIFQDLIYESGEVVLDENAYNQKRPGLNKIRQMRQDPLSISVFSEDGKNLIASSDLETYMESAGIFSVKEAVSNICTANNINLENTTIVYDGCSDYIKESIDESGILTEEAVEDNAMSVKQVQKWYNHMIRCSTSKTESIKEIDDRITMLKKCVEQMEGQLKSRKYDPNGRIKYVLKDFIPFNWIYRVIKRQDAYAGLGWVAGLFVPGASLVVRAVTYDKMLEDNIAKTKNAIEKLEDMKAELKKSK